MLVDPTCLLQQAMSLLMMPADYSLLALQSHLSAHGDAPLGLAEAQDAANLLERCVKTGEVLVAFALRLSGKPCRK